MIARSSEELAVLETECHAGAKAVEIVQINLGNVICISRSDRLIVAASRLIHSADVKTGAFRSIKLHGSIGVITKAKLGRFVRYGFFDFSSGVGLEGFDDAVGRASVDHGKTRADGGFESGRKLQGQRGARAHGEISSLQLPAVVHAGRICSGCNGSIERLVAEQSGVVGGVAARGAVSVSNRTGHGRRRRIRSAGRELPEKIVGIGHGSETSGDLIVGRGGDIVEADTCNKTPIKALEGFAHVVGYAEFETGATASIQAADIGIDNLSGIIVKRHVTIAGQLFIVTVCPGIGFAVVGDRETDAEPVATFGDGSAAIGRDAAVMVRTHFVRTGGGATFVFGSELTFTRERSLRPTDVTEAEMQSRFRDVNVFVEIREIRNFRGWGLAFFLSL